MNGLSGFQIVAANGLQSGEGIAPPNITANLSTYLSFAPVNNFSNIYATASTLPFGLTSANANLLLSIKQLLWVELVSRVVVTLLVEHLLPGLVLLIYLLCSMRIVSIW